MTETVCAEEPNTRASMMRVGACCYSTTRSKHPTVVHSSYVLYSARVYTV